MKLLSEDLLVFVEVPFQLASALRFMPQCMLEYVFHVKVSGASNQNLCAQTAYGQNHFL